MEAMNQQFNPSLDYFQRGILPEVFQVGYDSLAQRDDPFTYRSEDFFIGVVDEVE
jgi:hypothetical protein